MSIGTISLLLFLPILNGQIYFPNDQGGYMDVTSNGAPVLVPARPPAVNLSEIRGTQEYNAEVNKIVSTGILKLALSVEKSLTNATPHYDNIVFSPLSVASALALVLLGSNGKTFQEVSTIMGLVTGVEIQNKFQIVHEQFSRIITKLEESSGFNLGKQINVANAIFVQDGFPIRDIYKQAAQTIYNSEVLNVNFQNNTNNAQTVINAWVSNRTNGKIGSLLAESPSPDTKVILASALYFKAEWEKPFFEGSTRIRPFYTNGRAGKSQVMVEMMSNGGNFPYFKDHTLNCEILGFPYKGNHSTMYVVIPHQSNVQKLQELEAQLTPSQVERLISSVKYTRAIVLFPKMRIDSTIDLKQTLAFLGLRALFNPAEANLALLSAGLSGAAQTRSVTHQEDIIIFGRSSALNCTNGNCETITNLNGIASRATQSIDSVREYINQQPNAEKFENPGLYADSVIHKVFMDITESGTEAAASTSISLSRDGGRVTVRVDTPFYFFIIHEETKAMLFSGSVNTPTPTF